MKLRSLLILTCAAAAISATHAQVIPNRNVHHSTHRKTTKAPIRKIDRNVSELMADRVGFKKNIVTNDLISIDQADYEDLLSKESLMFPAEELYGSDWDNRFVNPFRNKIIQLPDSCTIDCSSFILPIDNNIKVTSVFGPRRRRMHQGIDLKVEVGDTIRVAFDGKIRVKNYERRGYGYYLVVRHPNGLETVYGHLSKFLVDENDIVRAGQPIALGGNTGRSTGSHLHFETRFLGRAINPADIINFENGIPHDNLYVFRNMRSYGRSANIYTSSAGGHLVYHRVRSGDTLGAIARRYGTSVRNLCRMNGLKPTSTLRIGQSLRCGTALASTKRSDRKQEETVDSQKAGQEKVAVKGATNQQTAEVKALNKKSKSSIIASVSQEDDSSAIYHRIQSGDTLGGIARKHGISIRQLCELNGISRTTILKIGRQLRCS